MPSKHGWKCSKCTFEHQFPGTRCVMCQSLRTTKEQLIGFVQGIPIPESSKINTSTISTASNSLPPAPGKAAAAAAATNKKTPALAAQPPPPLLPIGSDAERQQAQKFFLAAPPQTSTTTANNNNSNGNAAQSAAASGTAIPSSSAQNSAAGGETFHGNHNQSTNNHGHSNTIGTTDTSYAILPRLTNHDRSVEPTNGIHHTNAALPISSSNRNNSLSRSVHSTVNFNAATSANNNASIANGMANNNNRVSGQPHPATTNVSKKATTSNQRNRNATVQQKQRPGQVFNGVMRSHSKKRASLPYVPGPVPFDESKLSEWIFPIHDKYPKRDYQVAMAESAIFENTLVSLPTGLGKTMIAAVVMYNYYRWFPTGKVVFCAPTLPLVNQQVKAIYDIVGIPQTDIAVMTGKINATDREVLWNEKRVFFCTPQTVQNDLKNETSNIAFSDVVCLVLDEVHKASGDHAYVQVVNLLREETKAKFRLLGLSATPGTNIKTTQAVIEVLGVSKIDCRFEDDPDIKPHTHDRCDEIVIVQQTTLVTTIKGKILELMRPYLKVLQENQFLVHVGSGVTMTPYTVIQVIDDYKKKLSSGNPNVHPGLYYHFRAVHSLVVWKDSITNYGIGDLRTKLAQFLMSRQGGVVTEMAQSELFEEMKELVFKHTANTQGDHDAQKSLSENPKLKELLDVLSEHFKREKALAEQKRNERSANGDTLDSKQNGTSTRAIVFSQFRDSVAEIVTMLQTSRPLIRPSRFVGQGKGSKSSDTCNEATLKGMNQAEQQEVIQAFRDGTFNVLVCTSIGEEGLDVGQCDLIVMFDTLQSPTRMIQRVGRTGRARNGRVVLLLTKEEEAKYKNAKQREKTLLRSLKDPEKFKFQPDRLMFPSSRPLPALCEKTGLVNSAEFRLSQVVGNYDPTKRKRRKSTVRSGASSKKRKSARHLGWRLTEEDERRRADRLGSIIPCSFTVPEFPAILKKRFLKGREMSFSAQTPVDLSRYRLGSAITILRLIEETHGDRYDPSKISVPKSMLRGDKTIQSLFPLKETIAVKSPQPALPGNTTGEPNRLAPEKSSCAAVLPSDSTRSPRGSTIDAQTSARPPVERPQPPASGLCTTAETHFHVGYRADSIAKQPPVPQTKVAPSRNPYKKAAVVHRGSGAPVTKTPIPNSSLQNARTPPGIVPRQDRSLPPTKIRTNGDYSVSSTVLPPNESVLVKADKGPGKLTATVTGGSIKTTALSVTGTAFEKENSGRRDEGVANRESRTEKAVPADHQNQASAQGDVEFFLPTPPDSSSSEEDESDTDDDCDDECQDNEGSIRVDLANSSVTGLVNAEEPADEKKHCSLGRSAVNEGALSCGQPIRTSAEKNRVVIENLPKLKGSAGNDLEHEPGTGPDQASKSSFRLPTQSDSSSSSSEEEESDDKYKGITEPARATNEYRLRDQPCVLDNLASNEDDEDGAYESDSDDDLPLGSLRVNALYSGPQQNIMLPQRDTASSEESPGNDVLHRRKIIKKQNHFLTQVETPLLSVKTPQNIRRAHGGLGDTLIELVDTPSNSAEVPNSAQELADTPIVEANLMASNTDDDLDDISCAVCLSKSFHEDDPIVLCDGFAGVSCSLAVHASCYNLPGSDLNDGKEWRCDPCNLRQQIHVTKEVDNSQVEKYARCLRCQQNGGPLKRASKKIWHHPYCVQWQNYAPLDDTVCCICSEKGAVRCGKEGCKLAAHPHCAIGAISSGTPGVSWTFLRINDSSDSREKDKENYRPLMFCPHDLEEAKTSFDSLSAAKGKQTILTIPPNACSRPTKAPLRLKKIAERKISHPSTSRQHTNEVINLDALDDQVQSLDTAEARQARKRARLESRKRARRFIDEEAGIGSDDDLEGDAAEERDLAALEAEEDSINSFINDSSQLGYTQDELGRVDPEASATPAASLNDSSQGDALHRRVDNERTRQNQYATPLLNRKMTRNSLTPTNAPSSEKGLGRMHFVRSVLEHHKNGGDADEIERAYHQLEQEEAGSCDNDDDNQAVFDYGFED